MSTWGPIAIPTCTHGPPKRKLNCLSKVADLRHGGRSQSASLGSTANHWAPRSSHSCGGPGLKPQPGSPAHCTGFLTSNTPFCCSSVFQGVFHLYGVWDRGSFSKSNPQGRESPFPFLNSRLRLSQLSSKARDWSSKQHIQLSRQEKMFTFIPAPQHMSLPSLYLPSSLSSAEKPVVFYKWKYLIEWAGGGKEPTSTGDVRDTGSIPGSGRSPGGGHGNPLQYSCLEDPMDRGA